MPDRCMHATCMHARSLFREDERSATMAKRTAAEAEAARAAKEAERAAKKQKKAAEMQAVREAKAAAKAEAERLDKEQRLYMNVPYADKEDAEALGAKWVAERGKWCIPRNVNANNFLDHRGKIKWSPWTQDTGSDRLLAPYGPSGKRW